MTQGLKAVIEQIRNEGLARDNLFECFISGPRSPKKMSLQYQKIEAAIEKAQLPAKTIETSDVREHGPKRTFPEGVAYEAITLGFRCHAEMKERTFWDEWMNEVISTGDGTNSGQSAMNMNTVGWYDDFCGTCEIKLLNNAGDMVYGVKLLEFYPIGVSAQTLDVTTTNSYMTLDVSCVYRGWEKLN